MQYEDFQAIEDEIESREMEEMWLNEQDEMYIDLITEWERNDQNRSFWLDSQLKANYRLY